ncbi:hypothetical protein [Effusibacillus consociatus]|uniref:Uncharacterized protein n=1 Tax=Effusibacillus consociatus TaxID=1117041 RepID=A0ABV9Q8G9_9BACL
MDQHKNFEIMPESLEQLAQKQLEEMDETLSQRFGDQEQPDTVGLPQNRKTAADLFSDFPTE